MTATQVNFDQQVYVGYGYTDNLQATLHLGLVPYVAGLDALCGTPLIDATATTLVRALNLTGCSECRRHVDPRPRAAGGFQSSGTGCR